jgi:N-glycosylase/DNA lyase
MKLNCTFDLDLTLCCGQVFRWRKMDGWWYTVAFGKPFKIRQIQDELEFEGVTKDFVWNYFGLDDDLAEIHGCICKDKVVEKALGEYGKLRIIRQQPWECLISYVCATNKNIPAIEDMLDKICRKLGEKTCFDQKNFYCFPTVEKLALASEADLQDCSLGYRAKYVKATAQKILETKFDLENLKGTPYADAKKALLGFPGVGPKVADCALLFSLNKTEAFPVDVWVKRIMLKYYSNQFPNKLTEKMQSHKSLTPSEYEFLNGFGREYFGKYAGYAQEYLFHYERSLPKE